MNEQYGPPKETTGTIVARTFLIIGIIAIIITLIVFLIIEIKYKKPFFRKTLGIIMACLAIPVILYLPDLFYGLQYSELGAITEGYLPEDSYESLDFLGIDSFEDIEKVNKSYMKEKGKNAINTCLIISGIYCFIDGILLFKPIKKKKDKNSKV